MVSNGKNSSRIPSNIWVCIFWGYGLGSKQKWGEIFHFWKLYRWAWLKRCWPSSNRIYRIEVLKDEMVTKLLVSYLLIFSAVVIISFGELQTNCLGSKFWIIHFMSVKETKTFDMLCVWSIWQVLFGVNSWFFSLVHVMPTMMLAGDVQHWLSWHTSGATNQLICFFPLQIHSW